MMREIFVRCAAALAIIAVTGCQLIMEELEAEDAGSDGSAADPDATIIGPSDAGADAAEAAPVDAGEEPDVASADASPDAEADADADAAVAPIDAGLPDADPGACDGAGSRVFFEDGDKDGYGDPTSFQVACTAPADYVSAGDDCNDDNNAVHPEQTGFFGDGYRIPGSNLVSFDYDCDGDEIAGPAQERASPQGCQGVLPCTGAGYVEAARRNVEGANDHCGSTTILTCAALLVCTGGQQSTTDTPYVCH
jgi:hypothetical protein